jgi:hypothetical protein
VEVVGALRSGTFSPSQDRERTGKLFSQVPQRLELTRGVVASRTWHGD